MEAERIAEIEALLAKKSSYAEGLLKYDDNFWAVELPTLCKMATAHLSAGWRPISEVPLETLNANLGIEGDDWTDWLLLWVPDTHGGFPIVGSLESGEWIWRDAERACGTIETPPTYFMSLPQPPTLAVTPEKADESSHPNAESSSTPNLSHNFSAAGSSMPDRASVE